MSIPKATVGLADAISELLGPIGGQLVRDLTISEVQGAVLEGIELGGSSFMDLPEGMTWRQIPAHLQRPEYRMTASHWRAVVTAMLVEDHLPGFASQYLQIFPVEGKDDLLTNLLNSEVQNAVYRWLLEEQTHRYRLGRYCLLGAEDPQAILQLQATEGAKLYVAPSYRPVVLFTYTALQEYSTQLFYTMFRRNTVEPILSYTLRQIAADEARHCRLFLALIKPPLVRGDPGVFVEIQQMVQAFHMPLSHMLDNYLRRAADMRRACRGYDHREAFGYIARQLRKIAESNSVGVKHPIRDLIATMDELTPKPLAR